ncbi:hypothetical protein KKA15_03975 [Patescibacteria group bacterium]|nr:hypothetical protein [Patescibacteria group bacterium]
MAWGPFKTEAGGKPIIEHVTKQVFPIMKKLQQLSLEIGEYQQGFINSFLQSRLSSLKKNYNQVNKEFLEIYHIYQTPDELFKEVKLDKEKDEADTATIMSDYFNSQSFIKPHFDEGFGLLEIMDRNLTRYSQSADQRISTSLAIIAITISIVVAILK